MAIKPRNQGTGFTNVNRILQANQGNQLGSTVAGGVQNAAQKVQQGQQQSQQQFQQDAQKNRLDTQEAADKRQNIIGRFNNTNPQYAPDMSNFQVSSGLQQQYQTAKQQYEANKAKQQADYNQQLTNVNQRLTTDQGKLDAARKKYGDDGLSDGINMKIAEQQFGGSVKNLNQLKRILEKQGDGTGAIDQQIADLEAQYGQMTEGEKENYKRAEIDKMIAANMPTDAEIQDFTKYRAGVYGGPQELKDYQTLAGQAMEAEQLGNLTQSAGGKQELLRRFVGKEGYTQGQQRLDNMLLGQDGSALNKARRDTRGLQSGVSAANEQARNLAKEYTGRAKAFGEETTGMLNEARNPVSAQIDAQLAQLQGEENTRKSNTQRIQDILTGKATDVAGMDKMAQLGIGLQSAQDAGFLNQGDVGKLLGDSGLIARAQKLGMDPSALINERLQQTGAQNLNRGGAATSAQESQLTALDKLLGKQASDMEFSTPGADAAAGKSGFDLSSLEQMIADEEARKGIQSSSASGGATPSSGGFDPVKFAAGGGVAGTAGEMTLGAKNQLLSGLQKQLGNSEAGKQLARVLESTNKQEQSLLAGRDQLSGGVKDLTQGNISQGLKSIQGAGSNTLKNLVKNSPAGQLAKNASNMFGGGETGDWSGADYTTKEAATGENVKIGSFANKSSGEILNQLLSKQILDITGSKGGSGELHGKKVTDKLLKYYNEALKREGKA
jgi:hypothetical protein